MLLELDGPILSDYPDDFNDWPLEEKNLWFAEQERARKYKKQFEEAQENARKSNGSGRHHHEDDKPQEDEEPELPEINVAAFACEHAPPREWHVPDMIPSGQVTMFGGDGKVGKSKLAMQLCVATAAERDWLGMTTKTGPVLYIGAEDDVNEFHRRFEDIATSYNVRLDELMHNLILIPLADRDAVMAVTVKAGRIAPTANWRGVIAKIVKYKPCLVVFDSLADVYAGNEINRSEARQFIALLRSAAILYSLAAVLLSHPSLQGILSGSGTSGSTAWSNSVRSRLALERLKNDQGKEIEPNRRTLKIMRSNYGPAEKEIELRWAEGVWELDVNAHGSDEAYSASGAKAERVFLDLLILRNEQKRSVSESRSPTYAPSVFAAHPDCEKISMQEFAHAMERLLKSGRITTETSGPKSKQRTRLVVVPSTEDIAF